MLRYLALALALVWPAWAQQQLPYSLNQVTIPEQGSAAGVSNFVFRPINASSGNAKSLVSLTVVPSTTAGFAFLFDATVLPSNGAVTACGAGQATPCVLWCWPIAASQPLAANWVVPAAASAGMVAGYSTTGCDTLTASTTAKFLGQAM